MIKTAFQIKGTVGIFLRVVMNVNEKKRGRCEAFTFLYEVTGLRSSHCLRLKRVVLSCVR